MLLARTPIDRKSVRASDNDDDANASPVDEMDIGLLRRGDGMLPVVGLGGSAGGIAALQEFLAAMPVNSGMAFVVVLHLSPTHASRLTEMFQRSTAMPVVPLRLRLELPGVRVRPVRVCRTVTVVVLRVVLLPSKALT